MVAAPDAPAGCKTISTRSAKQACHPSAILRGGIEGWQSTYDEEMIGWYDGKVWAQENA